MKPTILTVNNQLNTQLLLGNSLGDKVEIVNCQDGFEALSWLHAGEHRADLLLVDMDMPALNGYDFTESIRKVKGMYDVPVVMISSRQVNPQRNKSFRINNSDYIQKPVKPEELMDRIIDNLKRRNQEDN